MTERKEGIRERYTNFEMKRTCLKAKFPLVCRTDRVLHVSVPGLGDLRKAAGAEMLKGSL